MSDNIKVRPIDTSMVYVVENGTDKILFQARGTMFDAARFMRANGLTSADALICASLPRQKR